MADFTPGPWRVVNGVDVQAGPQGCLAYVSTAGARGRTLDEARANATLIAAAPLLLEACKAMLPEVIATKEAYGDEGRFFADLIAQAERAIARAEGRS
jgi:hypothetical protein